MEYLLDKVIFWGSWLVFPLIVLIFWLRRDWRIGKMVFWIMLCLSLLFIYARFIEPQMIVVRTENFDFENNDGRPVHVKMILLSDQHLGVFKGEDFLKKTVRKIKELKPDLVLIAGDLIYDPDRAQLPRLYREMSALSVPVFAVAGNHDSQSPGDFASQEVRAAITRYGVTFIDNSRAVFEKEGKNLMIYGLSDHNENKVETAAIAQINERENSIILAHNPDSAHFLPHHQADLLVAGHTHGGQIRIPWVYKYVIPSEFDYDRGWYKLSDLSIYVTSGIGEVVLPMRLMIPPEIVVFDLIM